MKEPVVNTIDLQAQGKYHGRFHFTARLVADHQVQLTFNANAQGMWTSRRQGRSS
jgi:hypothetical protein